MLWPMFHHTQDNLCPYH